MDGQTKGMDSKHLVTYGLVGVAGLVLFFVLSSGKKTSTSYATDPGAAGVDAAIVTANANAITQGTSIRNNMIATAGALSTAHDNNQTAIAIAANNNATQVQLTNVAAAATVQSAASSAAQALQIALVNADVTKHANDLTAQVGMLDSNNQHDAAIASTVAGASTAEQLAYYSAHASDTAAYYQAQGQSTASYYGAITSSNQANAALDATSINANAAVQAAKATADAQTTSAVAAANAQKSASKNALWGNIAGAVANIFTGGASGAASSLSGAQAAGGVQASQVVGPYVNQGINTSYLPTSLPTYVPQAQQMSGGPYSHPYIG